MTANFNAPTVSTLYTNFPTQVRENFVTVAQQFSVGNPLNVPAGSIKFDLDMSGGNRWKKFDGNNYVDLTDHFNLNAKVTCTGLRLGDGASGGNNAIFLGDDNDLRIYHDASAGHSFIRDFNGAGNLKITASQIDILNNGNSEFMAKFIQNGSVELYHNNTKRFNTNSSGAAVTGTLTTTGTMFAQGGALSLTNTTGVNQIEVGAGQTTDQFAFVDLIGDATHTDFGLRLIRGDSTVGLGPNTNSSLTNNGTGQLQLVAAGAGKLAFKTNGSTRMFINQSGQISVGSTNPERQFEVASGGTPQMIIRSSAATSNDAILRLRGARTSGATDINQIIFETNDTGGGNYAAGSRLGSIICGKQSNNTTKGFFDFRLNNVSIVDGSLGAANVSKLYIKPSNEIGLGTTNPQRLLELASADQTSILRLHSSDTSISTNDRIGKIEFSGSDTGASGIAAFIEAIATNNVGQAALRFGTGTAGSVAEKIRMDQAGRLLLGVTSQVNSRQGTTNVQPRIQVHDEEDGSISMTRYANNSGQGGRCFIQKARGTIATPLAVADGDITGEIRFSGYEGNNFANGCTILNRVNGTVSTNTLPSDLEFYIRNSSGVSQELLTLNHDRFVGINKSTPAVALHVKQLTDHAGGLRVEDSGNGNIHCTIDVTDTTTSFTARQNTTHGNIRFQSNNGTTTTENMRLIQNTGVAIGATTNATSDKLTVTGGRISTNSFVIAGRGEGGVALTHNDGGGNANVCFNHVNQTPEQNGTSGRIDVNTDSTAGVAIMAFGLLPSATNGTSSATSDVVVLKRGSEADLGVGSNTNIRGQVVMPVGTTTFPSVCFSSDADTGITRSNADRMSLIAGGTEIVRIDSSGLDMRSGSLTADNAAKAWVKFNGDNFNMDRQFNVSSVTDNGVGDYTVNWDDDFSNNHYALVGSVSSSNHITNDGHGVFYIMSQGNGNARVKVFSEDSGNAVMDKDIVNVIAFH